jgi:hypothetical protein
MHRAGNVHYKRSDHFNNVLKNLQGLTPNNVSTEVCDMILLELRNEGKDLVDLDQMTVRRYLKQHGHSKFYDQTSHIIEHLTGIPPIRFSQDQEENLRNLFERVQLAFNQVHGNRINFLPMHYCIYKMCEVLGYVEFLLLLPNIWKNKTKLLSHDNVWEQICEILGLPFLQTIVPPNELGYRNM